MDEPVIKDQRHMTGSVELETVEQVRAYWREKGAAHGYPRWRQKNEASPIDGTVPALDVRLHASSETLVANVSMGRWVADCPRCGGGVALWRENDQACCLTCGTVYTDVDWPTPRQAKDAERVLALRPEEHRGWRRDRGEKVADLRRENDSWGIGRAA